MAYYRVACRLTRVSTAGIEYVWSFQSPLYVDRGNVIAALNMLYRDNANTIVVAGTTMERVEGHLIAFVNGDETVVWSRDDFLRGLPTDDRAVRAAEESIYSPKPETRNSTAVEDDADAYMKSRRRLEFYRWLFERGLLHDGKAGEYAQTEEAPERQS